MIYDWHRMIRTVDGWIPIQHRDTVRGLAREIDAAISGFLRGQTAVCLILGSFYAVALTLVGLNFGLLIGLISGLITFVPYVGSMTGLVLSLGVAVAQFWPDYGSILMVLAIFLVGQFVEGNVLSPKLVGESVGLHPVWLIFALLAFGYLFGFVGLLVAVPLAATIGVLCRFVLRRYLQSSFYTGETRIDRMNGPFAPRQLALALDHSVSFAREDFLSGPSNTAALALIERWPDWPDRIVALIGPEGSGKSHLAAIWAEAAGARVLSANLLSITDCACCARDRRAGRRGSGRRRSGRAGTVSSHQSCARRETRMCSSQDVQRSPHFRSQFATLLLDCAQCRLSCSRRRMTHYCVRLLGQACRRSATGA